MGDNNDGPRSGPPDISGLYSLKVDNLDYKVQPDDVKEMFSRFGEIGDCYMPRDHVSKESRGFAFVRFRDRRDAEASDN